MQYVDERTIDKLLPQRARESHKGDYGKILILCGSKGYTGAPYFAAMGALRVGAGLVYLGVPESIYQIEAVKLNEPVVISFPDRDGTLSHESIPKIAELLPRMDAVLFGCGSGLSAGSEEVLLYLLENCSVPLVLDADGITLVSGHIDVLRGRTGDTILTPHDGEFLRLGPCDVARVEQTMELASRLRSVVVRKGHRTLVSDGNFCYENITGNPGMAVGGSGDVLAGIIAGLLGQGLTALNAAACGAWLHGKAGDLCACQIGEYGMLPSDMLNFLPRLLR